MLKPVRRILFSLVFICISACTSAQPYLIFPICHNDSFRFNWKPLDKKVSRSDAYKFIQGHSEDFEVYLGKGVAGYDPDLDSLYNDLHFIDLNGDGLNDVVFDGQSGG